MAVPYRFQPPRLHDLAREIALPQAQDGSGTTVPVSPARRLTDTTVAFGKKLNSEALAQV